MRVMVVCCSKKFVDWGSVQSIVHCMFIDGKVVHLFDF